MSSNPKIRPTAEQLEVADRFGMGDSLKINAYAGTGKTTTLEYVSKRTNRRGLYLAFNRVIAKEARQRFGSSTDCMTIHALARRSLPDSLKERVCNDNAVPRRILEDHLVRHCGVRRSEAGAYGTAVLRLLSTFYRTTDEHPKIATVASIDDANLAGLEPNTLRRATESCWASMVDLNGKLPLTHGAYLKRFLLFGQIDGYDYLVVDEAQDLGPVTIRIVRKAGFQTVWVGDKYQSIYEFNGAENALDTIDGLQTLYLTQCFRVGIERAELVSRLLFQMGATAPITGNPNVRTVVGKRHQPVRIARTNMTLLAKLLKLPRSKKVFVLSGADKLERLLTDTELLMQGKKIRSGMLSGFRDWGQVKARSVQRFGYPYKDYVRAIEEHGCANARKALANTVSDERGADVVLTTTHGVKGREYDAVSIYDDFRGKRPEAGFGTWIPDGVTRLLYVAVTRAKETLFLEKPLRDRFDLGGVETILVEPISNVSLSEPPPDPEFEEEEEIHPAWTEHPVAEQTTRPSTQSCAFERDRIRTPAPSQKPQSAYQKYGVAPIIVAVALFLRLALDYVGVWNL